MNQPSQDEVTPPTKKGFLDAHPYLQHNNISTITQELFTRIRPEANNPARIHVLTGPTAVGKTTTIKRIAGAYEHACKTLGLPSRLLRIDVPSDQSLRPLLRTCLRQLNADPGTSRDSTQMLYDMLKIRLRMQGVTVIVMDEAQHFLKTRSRAGANESIDALKQLHDQTNTHLILCGIPPLLRYVREDDQLISRLSKIHHLLPYNAASVNDRQAFEGICQQILTLFAQHHGMELDLPPDTWALIALVTSGRIGRLTNWLEEAETKMDGKVPKALTLTLLKDAMPPSGNEEKIAPSFWSNPSLIHVDQLAAGYRATLRDAGFSDAEAHEIMRSQNIARSPA